MKQNHDVLLILGCGIDSSGVLIDDAQASVKKAVSAWNDEPESLVIMSGRVSYKAGFEPPISEAQAMKDYAVSLGLPADKILTEVESKDTLGNAVFTRLNLLDPLAIKSVLIIPGPNHSMERLAYIFKKVLGTSIAYSFLQFDQDKPLEQQREQQSLQIMKKWFGDVRDGDVTAVYRVMRARHPGYRIM